MRPVDDNQSETCLNASFIWRSGYGPGPRAPVLEAGAALFPWSGEGERKVPEGEERLFPIAAMGLTWGARTADLGAGKENNKETSERW